MLNAESFSIYRINFRFSSKKKERKNIKILFESAYNLQQKTRKKFIDLFLYDGQ